MSKKDLALIVLVTILLAVLWIVNGPRLEAYDDCYMAKYQDWSTDCVLTE